MNKQYNILKLSEFNIKIFILGLLILMSSCVTGTYTTNNQPYSIVWTEYLDNITLDKFIENTRILRTRCSNLQPTFEDFNTRAIQETVFIDTGLTKNTTYTYRVAGQNDNITGVQSPSISARTNDGALRSGMTPQQMLECTSGSIIISTSEWDTLRSISTWVIHSSTNNAAGSGGFIILTADTNYLESWGRGLQEVGLGVLSGIPQRFGDITGNGGTTWKLL